MSQMIAALDRATLPRRILAARTAWNLSNAANDLQLIPVVPTLRAMLRSQTARIPELDNRERKPELDIAWLESCQNTAALKTNVWVRGIPCDYSGWKVGTGKQKVTIKTNLSETFQTPGVVYDNLFSVPELFNRGYAQATKNLAEKLNRFCIANMSSWAGKNLYQKGIGSDGNATTPGLLTKIPYANLYPQSLNNYLAQVQRMNLLINPTLFEGGLLELDERVDNSAYEFKFGRSTAVSDMESFGPLGLGNTMFYVAQGAMAIFSTFNHPQGVPTRYESSNGGVEYGVSLPFLDLVDANGKQLMVDMTYKRMKVNADTADYSNLDTSNRCEFYDVFNLELNFEHVLNPLGCHNGVSGIIQITPDNTLPMIVTPHQAFKMVQVPA